MPAVNVLSRDKSKSKDVEYPRHDRTQFVMLGLCRAIRVLIAVQIQRNECRNEPSHDDVVV